MREFSFWSGFVAGLGLLSLILIVNLILKRREKISFQFSLEEMAERRKHAAKILSDYGIVVHKYHTNISSMLDDVGIYDPPFEVHWALMEFDRECFVFTNKSGTQWGTMIPLAKIDKTKTTNLKVIKLNF